MSETSAIIIPDASALVVSASCIDCSEVSNQEDKDFLIEKGEKILRIITRAALEVGQEIVEIQNRFKGKSTGELTKFYASLGIDKSKACRWANKFRAYSAYFELFGGEDAAEKFQDMPETTAARIWSLPTE